MNKELKEIIEGIKRTLRLIESSEKKALLIAMLIMLITGFLTNIPAVILGNLVDKLTVGDNFQFSSILPFIFLIVAVIVIREILTVIRKYSIENIATQTEKKQTVATISHILKADALALEDFRLGTLHGRIFRSIEGLVRLIKLGFLDFLPALFTAIAALIIALTQKPLIAGIMILVIPAGLFIITKQIASQKGIRVKLLRDKEKIDGNTVEVLGGLETVRSLNTSDHETKRIEAAAEQLRQKEIKHHLQMALYDAAKYLNEGFFYILVIVMSIYLASTGVISKGDVLVYSILFLSVLNPLRQIHRILDEAHESSIRVNDLYDLRSFPLDESYSPKTLSIDEIHSSQKSSDISIKNLSYSYHGRHDQKILNDINLQIMKGEKIGIAGVSGGGKSTLVKILLRLIHAYSGSVSILGADLKDLNRTKLANIIAYIPQKTYIFSGTIRENIVYGSDIDNIDDNEIIEAAKKAEIWNEINRSLGGLDGKITEQGNNLSGGQKQRLTIARLVFHSPEIIVFDEATSALDNKNEAAIQKMIETFFKDKTILIIAHRLTTLKACDRILVLDKGSIVQEGTFKELETQPGMFKIFLNAAGQSK